MNTSTDADLRHAAECLLGVPFTTGNTVEVLRNGDSFFPRLLRDLQNSARTIDMEWFLWGTGDITDQVAYALAERATSGVRVRVMLDAFGAHGMARTQLRMMRRAGVCVRFYHPLPGIRPGAMNLRTHRRVLICDEKVAFTGGMGIDAAWTGDGTDPAHWRDTGYRVRGPAVGGIRAGFVEGWLQTADRVIEERDRLPRHDPAGNAAVQVLTPHSGPGWNASLLAVEMLVELAQERVRVATPYCRVPHRLLAALSRAGDRGVALDVLVPGPHRDRPWVNQQMRYDYEPLMATGATIWHFQPTMLHHKLVTVDRRIAMVGTTNFDTRSFALNQQVAMLLDHQETVARLDADYDDDLQHSERLNPQVWRSRRRRERLRESAAYIVGYPLRGLGSFGMTSRLPCGPTPFTRRG